MKQKSDKPVFYQSKIAQKIDRLSNDYFYSSAQIEVTNRCNASCDYCYIENRETTDLSKDKFYKIFDKLDEEGVLAVSISGGEPFIRSDILDILEYAVKKDFWDISIVTNGSLINEDHIRFICEHSKHISHVQISFFSHIPTDHDSYTGVKGSFKRSFDAAKKLMNGGSVVMIAVNLIEENVKTFEETCVFFTEAGFPVSWSIFKITPQSKGNTDVRSVEFYTQLLNVFSPEKQESEKKLIVNSLTNSTPISDLLLCRGLFNTISINYQGALSPCVSFRGLTLGNIFEQRSLHDIVKSSKELQYLRSLHISDIKECSNCKYVKACHFCVGINYSLNGTCLSCSKQHCNYIKAAISFFGL